MALSAKDLCEFIQSDWAWEILLDVGVKSSFMTSVRLFGCAGVPWVAAVGE
jgi:hypothetical protein